MPSFDYKDSRELSLHTRYPVILALESSTDKTWQEEVDLLVENIHFGHLLDLGCTGNMLSQSLKSSVNCFNSVPLPFISLDSFQVLLRFDGVAMDGMNQLYFRSGSHVSCVSVQMELLRAACRSDFIGVGRWGSACAPASVSWLLVSSGQPAATLRAAGK